MPRPLSATACALLLAALCAGAPVPVRAAPGAGEVVREFLVQVRSGRDPDAAGKFMAPQVMAHQVTSEGEFAIERTPTDYADHVREFVTAFGRFDLTIEEFLVDGARVYVRWKQVGRHVSSLAGEPPSGRPLVEITSVVYRVENGLIVEYWLQTDRKGFELQVEAGR